MLIKVEIVPKNLESYRPFISETQYQDIQKYAHKLKGVKVAHINATQYGGGAAEILQCLVPLMQGIGMKAEWYIIPQREEFNRVLLTKKFHMTLQGDKEIITEEEKKSYIESSKSLAEMTIGINPDIWVMHDPQALGSGHFLKDKSKAKILRIHIDLSNPNKNSWDFLLPYITSYDKVIFHAAEYVPKDFPKEKIAITPPRNRSAV